MHLVLIIRKQKKCEPDLIPGGSLYGSISNSTYPDLQQDNRESLNPIMDRV